MSEVVVPQQESLQEVEPEQQEFSAEDRLLIASGIMADPNEKPRDEKGRFTKQEQEQEGQQQQQGQQPEQKAEAEEKPEEKAEETSEEIQWEQIKDLKVKVPMKNGDKEWQDEITFEDLRNQRMMHADYMQRREEFTKKELEYQKQVKESVEKERTQYLDTLNVLHQSVLNAAQQELSGVDWERLASEDPATYVKVRARAERFGATLQQLEAEQRSVKEKSKKEEEETRQKRLVESDSKLKEAIPDWEKEDTKKAIFKTALEFDFTPEEIGRVDDHRFVRLLNEAREYRNLKAQKSQVEKKVSSVPPVLRPKAQAPKVSPAIQQFQQARERIKANPNDMDAQADLMRAFIK